MTARSGRGSIGWSLALACLVALGAACSSSGDGDAAGAGSVDTADVLDGSAAGAETTEGAAASVESSPQTAAATEPVADTTVAPTVPTTIQAVSTVVLGGVVGGNSGAVGEGSTASRSEVVRNEDGSCTGWDGRRGSGWTENFTAGAEAQLLDAASGEVLATGTLGDPVAENVALSDDSEQWQCWFPFTFTTDRPPAAQYAISVGGGRPLLLANDTSRAGFVVGSIGTAAEAVEVEGCSGTDPLPEEVSDWQSVGQYWDSGVSSICFAGLTVADGAIHRPCRPRGIASDRVISVTDAADPSIVYEDASGLLVDPDDLEPGTPVVVNVASGIPCS